MNEFFQLLDYVLQLFQIGQSPQAFLVLIGLAFARIVAFLSIVPFFGGAAVPSRVKVATATALVIIAYPALAAKLPVEGAGLPFGPLGFLLLIVKEVFVGFTLGFIASGVFEAIQMAGRIVDMQRGETMSEVMAPQLQERTSEIGQLKFQLAIVIFVSMGFHLKFIKALIESFIYIPAMEFPKVGAGMNDGMLLIIELTAHTLLYGVQLALPIVLALLFTDLFFGIINRVAPQVNVFFLSMPVKMALGIFLVMVAIYPIRDRFIYYFGEYFQAFEFMIRYLSNTASF